MPLPKNKKTRRESNSDASWMKKGKEISREEEKLTAEQKRRSEQRKITGGIDPNQSRFRLKTGEQAEVIVLDESPDTVAFYEHNIKRDGHFGNFEGCPGEWSNCPLCASGDNKAFVWFLTVLDLRGYEKKDGTEVPYMRRLLPIKSTQATAYKRVLNAAMKAHGTTRGVMLTLERDTNEKSASIGEPVINEDGDMFNFLEEDELIEDYGHAAIKSSKTGDVLVKKNGLLQPFDYEVIFQKPDAKDIAKRWGLGPQAGSDEEYEEEAADDRSSRSTRRKSNRHIEDAEEEEEEDDDVEDEDDDDSPPKRSAKKKAKKTLTKRRPVDEDEDDEEEEEDDEESEDEDDDPPPSKKSFSKKKAKPLTKRKASASDDDDDDDVPFKRRRR